MARTRNYASIYYQVDDVKSLVRGLTELHVAYAISPVHDRDVDDDGNLKKAHIHVVIVFSSVKSLEQARDVFLSLGCVGCEAVLSIRSYLRYLTHMDDNDKILYDQNDVIFSGLDYFELCSLPGDRYQLISDMMDYIDENEIVSFSYFVRICRKNRQDWFRSLCQDSTYVIKEYIKGIAWEKEM